MRSRRPKRQAFSLSFLDCICCGFGAVILLITLSRFHEPVTVERSRQNLEELMAALHEEKARLRDEAVVLGRTRTSAGKATAHAKAMLRRLQRELEILQDRHLQILSEQPVLHLEEAELRAARQTFTEEMERLLGDYRRTPGEAIGGIPIDSEYIIFVIDTSGSMQSKWSLVEQKLVEVLDAYPTVKGLQVMNDNGRFMFQRYGRSWMPDTPQMRQAIKDAMPHWTPASDSDPSDGIAYAVDTFRDPEKKISIYVFGDEFQGNSMEVVVRDIDRLNAVGESGDRHVRIHAIGFPYAFDSANVPVSSQRFAALMRVVCERNGGTFVALTDRGPGNRAPAAGIFRHN